MKFRILLSLFFFLTVFNVFSFVPRRPRCHDTPAWKRITVWSGHGAFYVGTYIPLYATWYKPYGFSSFHFFNDNAEWRSMDKMGHGYTAFKLASFSYHALDWAYPTHSCSVLKNDRKKTWIASGYSMLYLTTLEVFDGFSNGWGFSGGDMLANTLGVGLFAAQKAWCREIFMRPKFSSHSTGYANYRPEVLGATKAERVLKDYNGQTYWLSIGLPAELVEINKWKWINLSIGYNAYGMTGGSFNPAVNEKGEIIPPIERTSRMLLSMDIDWERFAFMQPSNSMFGWDKEPKRWVKILFRVINSVKLPFPAIEFQKGGGVKVHAFYF